MMTSFSRWVRIKAQQLEAFLTPSIANALNVTANDANAQSDTNVQGRIKEGGSAPGVVSDPEAPLKRATALEKARIDRITPRIKNWMGRPFSFLNPKSEAQQQWERIYPLLAAHSEAGEAIAGHLKQRITYFFEKESEGFYKGSFKHYGALLDSFAPLDDLFDRLRSFTGLSTEIARSEVEKMRIPILSETPEEKIKAIDKLYLDKQKKCYSWEIRSLPSAHPLLESSLYLCAIQVALLVLNPSSAMDISAYAFERHEPLSAHSLIHLFGPTFFEALEIGESAFLASLMNPAPLDGMASTSSQPGMNSYLLDGVHSSLLIQRPLGRDAMAVAGINQGEAPGLSSEAHGASPSEVTPVALHWISPFFSPKPPEPALSQSLDSDDYSDSVERALTQQVDSTLSPTLESLPSRPSEESYSAHLKTLRGLVLHAYSDRMSFSGQFTATLIKPSKPLPDRSSGGADDQTKWSALHLGVAPWRVGLAPIPDAIWLQEKLTTRLLNGPANQWSDPSKPSLAKPAQSSIKALNLDGADPADIAIIERFTQDLDRLYSPARLTPTLTETSLVSPHDISIAQTRTETPKISASLNPIQSISKAPEASEAPPAPVGPLSIFQSLYQKEESRLSELRRDADYSDDYNCKSREYDEIARVEVANRVIALCLDVYHRTALPSSSAFFIPMDPSASTHLTAEAQPLNERSMEVSSDSLLSAPLDSHQAGTESPLKDLRSYLTEELQGFIKHYGDSVQMSLAASSLRPLLEPTPFKSLLNHSGPLSELLDVMPVLLDHFMLGQASVRSASQADTIKSPSPSRIRL